MSRYELKSLADRCTRADRRYLLAYLRTKDSGYSRKLTAADQEVKSGHSVRLRATRRGLVRVAA
ncbi:MAG: hypothetical protein ABIQ12_13155 [Opitutaceae bacterium]